MASTVFPAASAGKTRFVTTLTSGTSYTVPAGVTYVNVSLQGGGGGAAYGSNVVQFGMVGALISSNLVTTPGNSIAYAIGAGGSGGVGGAGSAGGTTTFTGATSANGGAGGVNSAVGAVGTSAPGWNNGGGSANGGFNGGAGGAGKIDVEYWA